MAGGGGSAPYTLVIDGESRDASGDYTGSSGIASVSCADTSVGTFFDSPSKRLEVKRWFSADPQIDSGLKTIHAVVTDATGRTVEATAKVYVIFATGRHEDLLRAGQTYRVWGHLITVPEGIDMRIYEVSHESPGGVHQSFWIVGTDPPVLISLDVRTFEEVNRKVPRRDEAGDTTKSSYTGAEISQFHTQLLAFRQSVGELPELDGGDE